MPSGAYLVGALDHSPPSLGRQESIISTEQYAKLQHGPPLWNLGRKSERTSGQNQAEDLFFCWSSPTFGQKNRLEINGLITSGEIFRLVFITLKFPDPTPPFENPAYATGCQLPETP